MFYFVKKGRRTSFLHFSFFWEKEICQGTHKMGFLHMIPNRCGTFLRFILVDPLSVSHSHRPSLYITKQGVVLLHTGEGRVNG
jgi:hypothetical protein